MFICIEKLGILVLEPALKVSSVQFGLVQYNRPTLRNSTPISVLRFHCRSYPYLAERNSYVFYKVFKDLIITKVCIIMQERQRQMNYG